MKDKITYSLVLNHGENAGFEHLLLSRHDFIRELGTILKPPKKIFLGLGDFLEAGDYKKLLDTVFFDEGGAVLENILDRNNRMISESEDIPFSFFKFAVYFPDFLLKDIPVFCVSAIGRKSRLFPGAWQFIRHIKKYSPMVLTAMPWEVAVEFTRRLGLDDDTLVATRYATAKDSSGHEVYSGGIETFVSGERKSLEIESCLSRENLTSEDALYIGTGESGIKTFSSMNSIAFNTSSSVTSRSKISVYGSFVDSLLPLFNFNGDLDSLLMSELYEPSVPSLAVVSDGEGKNSELLELEKSHLTLHNNIAGQMMERSGDSYQSVVREMEIELGGSFVDITQVRDMISDRLGAYRDNPQKLVREIYETAKESCGNFDLL